MTRPTRAARAEHDALLAALDHYRPPCRGDARFTDDDQPASALEPICARCSILPECGEYADAAHPAAGIWAGRRWATAEQRRRAAA